MTLILIDTNIIIAHLKEGFLTNVAADVQLVISVISEAEVLRLSGLSSDEVRSIDRFLSICRSLPIDSSIARRAAAMGRTRKTKLPDLLIAASALEYGLPLLTLNERDFKNIPGLILKTTV